MAHNIAIPRLGWSMEEGTFVRWLKKDGDLVRLGETIFELEGEKALQEIEAVDEGILHIPASGPSPGSVLKVGTVIGYLVNEGEPLPAANSSPVTTDILSPDNTMPPVASPSVRRLARTIGVSLSEVEGTGRGGRILIADVERAGSSPLSQSPKSIVSGRPSARVASPRARRVASEMGIDWKELIGTGAGGRVRECDVLAAGAQRSSIPASVSQLAGGQHLRIPHSPRRRLIAQRMVASSQQTVPVTLTTKADATNLVNLRQQFKAQGGLACIPSYQDIITKLVGETLKAHPLLTGRWEEDAIVLAAENELHLGIAVDTDDGLLVPVIRDVGAQTLMGLANQSRHLIERARAGLLTASDMQDGVFTITNLGALGIDAFTPIINTPQSAILGLGAIRTEPVALADGQLVARQLLTLSLTFDHRVMDGAPAARFLQDLGAAIANPSATKHVDTSDSG